MNPRTGARRALALLAVALAAVVTIAALPGCGPDPKVAIEEKVNADFGSVKNLDEAEVEKYLGTSSLDKFERYGVSADEVVKAVFAHFSYAIDSVEVDGDNAQVALTVTSVDLKKALSSWMTSFLNWAETEEAATLYTEKGEDAIAAQGVKTMMEALSASDAPVVSNGVTLTLSKTDDGWEYTNKEEVASALMAGQSLSDVTAGL